MDSKSEAETKALQVPDRATSIILHNVIRMELMVSQVLEKDVDFGRSPGVPQPYLWDSGAGKIMAGYNVYPKHLIIHQNENPNGALTIVVETSLISRDSDKVVGTGVGAASGLEVKNKYRWVAEPAEYGIDKAGLKSELRDNRQMYRIINPEFGEQWHNLVKSAAKRSEIDAVQSLPGVLSALKKLAKGELNEDISLTGFWVAVKGLGYTETSVYLALGIKSLKVEWQGKGHKLSEALDILARKAGRNEGFEDPPEPVKLAVERPERAETPLTITKPPEATPEGKQRQSKPAEAGGDVAWDAMGGSPMQGRTASGTSLIGISPARVADIEAEITRAQEIAGGDVKAMVLKMGSVKYLSELTSDQATSILAQLHQIRKINDRPS